MLIFQHVLLGLVLGIIIALLLRKPSAVFYAGFGSILPDLIDKPLAYMILEESLIWGRAYAHTLIFALIICLIGVICIIKNKKKILLLCIGIGCISHQITDTLKFNDWMYPFTTSGHMPAINPILFCLICIAMILISYLIWERYSLWCVLISYLIWERYSLWCVLVSVICSIGICIWYGLMGVPSTLSDYVARMLLHPFPSYEIICLIVSCIIIVSLIYIMKFKIKSTN